MSELGPTLEEFVRDVAGSVLGTDAIKDIEPLQLTAGEASLLLRTRTDQRMIMKVARDGARPEVDFERTAAAMALARGAGVPVAETLAADATYRAGPWQYLLHSYLDGIPWHRARPHARVDEVDSAHRQLAEAVLALQSVELTGYGELDRSGQSSGADLLTGLRCRAELRLVEPRNRALFDHVLEQNVELFADAPAATLCHDDLHHANVIFRLDGRDPVLVGFIDWDKAWAGPAESDLARMALWDDMTGPGFWSAYGTAALSDSAAARRILIYQLMWCLDYDESTPRHRADTARLGRALGVDAG
ncbi:MAG TPA: aminoglycoside phosphotransferase family protein [Propionibacteriaceae bacterium]|nr:aminoglycoside phosphotransferase family protein [Propionibacteriaceae bacterium]